MAGLMSAVGSLSMLIRQTEAAECGLACLAMVANHHGYETDLASLRRRRRWAGPMEMFRVEVIYGKI